VTGKKKRGKKEEKKGKNKRKRKRKGKGKGKEKKREKGLSPVEAIAGVGRRRNLNCFSSAISLTDDDVFPNKMHACNGSIGALCRSSSSCFQEHNILHVVRGEGEYWQAHALIKFY
jgi:hypothetical protein